MRTISNWRADSANYVKWRVNKCEFAKDISFPRSEFHSTNTLRLSA